MVRRRDRLFIVCLFADRLLFAVLLVGVGWGAAGAIGGLIAAQVVAGIVAGWWAHGLGLRRPQDQPLLQLPSRRLLAGIIALVVHIAHLCFADP